MALPQGTESVRSLIAGWKQSITKSKGTPVEVEQLSTADDEAVMRLVDDMIDRVILQGN